VTQQGGRSNHVLAAFLKTFAKEDDLKVIPLFAESFHLGCNIPKFLIIISFVLVGNELSSLKYLKMITTLSYPCTDHYS